MRWHWPVFCKKLHACMCTDRHAHVSTTSAPPPPPEHVGSRADHSSVLTQLSVVWSRHGKSRAQARRFRRATSVGAALAHRDSVCHADPFAVTEERLCQVQHTTERTVSEFGASIELLKSDVSEAVSRTASSRTFLIDGVSL